MDTGLPPTRVTDDRNVSRQLVLPWWTWLVPAGAWYWRVPAWRRGVLLGLSVLVTAAAFALAASALGLFRWRAWHLPAQVGLTIASLLAQRRFARPFLHQVALDPRSFVRPGHCSACGYELGRIAHDHDGCTVCPECGAAWRVSERGFRV